METGTIVLCYIGGLAMYIGPGAAPDQRQVLFPSGDIEDVSANRMGILPDRLVRSLEFGEFENTTDAVIMRRARQYYAQKKIQSVLPKGSGDSTGVTATIQGSRLYRTDITCKKNSLLVRCSCPYDGVCKHAIALCLKLRDDIALLRTVYKNHIQYPDCQEDLPPLSEQLSTAVTALASAKADIYRACRDITDALKDQDASMLIQCLNVLYAGTDKPARVFKELLRALVLCNDTRDPALGVCAKWTTDHDLSREYRKAIDGWNAFISDKDTVVAIESGLLHCYYNHNTDAFISMIMQDTSYLRAGKGVFSLTIEEIKACATPEQQLVICRMMADDYNNDGQEAALALAEHLPKSGYLRQYLSNIDARSWRTAPLKLSDQPITPAERAAVDMEALLRYFDIQWNVEDANHRPILRITVYPKGTFTYSSVMVFTEDMQGKLTMGENKIDQRRYSPLAEAIRDTVYELEGEQIRTKKRQLDEELREQERLKAAEHLKGTMNALLTVLPSYEEAECCETCADIEFFVDSERSFSAGSWLLSMKIGDTRRYVVRDIVACLNRFQTGEVFRYGKELLLTHTLENLREEKRDAVRLLMLYADSGSFNRDKRCLPLSDLQFARFLTAMKGNSLSLADIKYEVRLDALQPRISVDRKCVLHFSLRGSEKKMVVLGNELFCFDGEAGMIDRIPGTEQQKQLYRFAAENDGVSLETALAEFTDHVYSRFYPEIEIADELKDRIKLSVLAVNAYFDYQNGTITCRTELCRDGEHVTETQLNTPQDMVRFSGYRRYLEHLGFQNGLLEDSGQVLNFLTMDMKPLKKHCTVYLSESIQNKKLQTFSKPTIRIQCESNIMQAFLTNSEYDDDELKRILVAIRKRKKFIQLKGDRIVDLTEEDALRFQEAVEDIGMDQAHLTAPSTLSMPQALRAFAHERDCRIDEYLYRMIEDIRGFKAAEYPIPPVQAELRPYQADGYRWLRTLAGYHVGGILADDMGLGKTLQFITLLASDPTPGPDLVVCPKSLVFNWVNEFRRFDPETRVIEVYGTAASRRDVITAISPTERAVYVTSYDSLRNDYEWYVHPLRYLILDEAQAIKNVVAAKSQTVKRLRAEHRFALTGTPIENSVLDLWSLFDFIMPGYFPELSTFRSSYNRDDRFADTIAKRIAPFVLRRTKRDVLKDLPEKYERILSVEMLPRQRKVYDAYKREAAKLLAGGAKAFEVLPHLMRLRQICDDPGLFVPDYDGGSGKLDALSTLLEDALAEGHRILIFSQFVKALSGLETMLNGKNIPFYRITGDTPAKDRIDQMNRFNQQDGADVFLISLKAGGTGLNLTGADMVIHLDPWWNVAAEDQASDRAHRIGQTRNVEVIKLICEDSVEQRVIELQNLKKDIIDRLISNDESSVTGVTLEDISFILK